MAGPSGHASPDAPSGSAPAREDEGATSGLVTLTYYQLTRLRWIFNKAETHRSDQDRHIRRWLDQRVDRALERAAMAGSAAPAPAGGAAGGREVGRDSDGGQ